MADAIGLIALAGLMLFTSSFVPSSQMPSIVWLLVYPVGAAFSLFIWHHDKAPKSPVKWLQASAFSVVAALLWFGFATIGARMMFADEPAASKAFDLTVTLIIAPGFTIVAILGWVRALVLQGLSARNKKNQF